jgi:hypothetical protein
VVAALVAVSAIATTASAAALAALLLATLSAAILVAVVVVAVVLIVLPRRVVVLGTLGLAGGADLSVGRGGWRCSSGGIVGGHIRWWSAWGSAGLTIGGYPESGGGGEFDSGAFVRDVAVWIGLAGLVWLAAIRARPTAATMGTSTFVHATESVDVVLLVPRNSMCATARFRCGARIRHALCATGCSGM